jgi:hypothetical protein
MNSSLRRDRVVVVVDNRSPKLGIEVDGRGLDSRPAQGCNL